MDNQPPNNNILQVKIVSPKAVIFESQALAVSSQNSAGKFDILPEHANFVTLVQQVPIIIKTASKENKTFQFSMAIIYNTANRVHIYTDIQQSLNPTAITPQATAEAIATTSA